MNTKYSIKNYLDFLENKRNELEKHPSPYCEKCHGTGEAEIYAYAEKKCYSNL